MTTFPVQVQSFQIIGDGAVAGAISLTLASFNDILGNPLAMSSFGDIGYGVIEPNTTNEDAITFTGITQNSNGTATLTGVNSVDFIAPYTASAGLRISHAGSVTFIITNSAAWEANFANKQNSEIITKNWSVPDPIAMKDIANKEYVLSVVNGGSVSVSSVIVAGTADTTIVAGQVLYLKSNGRWALADGSISSTVYGTQLGIAQGSGTSGNAITGGVLINGIDANQSGLSAGASYYVRNGGGLPSSSAGTFSRLIGLGISPTTLSFSPNSDTLAIEQTTITATANDIPKANSSGFISEGWIQNIITAGVDQSQTTSNSTQVVGATNATTKQFLLAEKFVPVSPSTQGITLWKIADTGSFTGTVKVALQADTAGSPSGTDLASFTITNAIWLKIPAAGEFTVVFGTPYESMVVGGSYWVVVTPSTNDNSNHPNLGANSAGGYAAGSLKYFNATDGWVQIATSILYFKINEGIFGKLIQTDATSGLPAVNVRPYSLVSVDTTSASVSNSITETTVFAKMLPGAFLSANGGLRIKLVGSLAVSTSGNGNVTIKLKFNGTTITSINSSTANVSSNTVGTWQLLGDFIILNSNSVSSQTVFLTLVNEGTTISGTPSVGTITNAVSTTVGVPTNNVDFSTLGLFEITYTLSSATATISAAYAGSVIEKIG